jgi:hypothetical protein
MKARWFRTCGVLLACATLTLVACGDDSTTDAGVAGTGASGTSASGTGGGGGGTGGSKAGTGGGGSAAVMCGGVACTVNSQLKMLNPAAAACCTATTMKCGQYNSSMKCLEKNAPGTPDPSCPTINVTIPNLGMFPQMGCCTANKKCGGLYSAVEYGCVAREDVDMGMGGPLMSLGCGAGDGGGDAGL